MTQFEIELKKIKTEKKLPYYTTYQYSNQDSKK